MTSRDDPDAPRTYSFDLSAAEAVIGSEPIVDAPRVRSEDDLRGDLDRMRTEFSDGDGARITATPAHEAFVSWIEDRLRGIDGVEVEAIPYEIDRWTPDRLSLAVDGLGETPTAGYVPFGTPTGPEGVEADLVHVERGRDIADAAVSDAIVVREYPPIGAAPASSLSRAHYVHDPAVTYEWERPYERYAAARKVMEADMDAASDAGAAGVLFVLSYPREEFGLYLRPNFQGAERSFRFRGGVHWDTRGLFLGADDGGDLISRLDAGEDLAARLVVDATVEPATTRTVIGRVPGESEETVVVTTHTDGVNMVQENGPVGLLAMAEYLAGLPGEERPDRTIEFGFATGHFYGRIGARDYAQRLAEGEQDVVCAISPEHFGVLDLDARPREGHGERLVQTDLPGSLRIYASESPALVREIVRAVVTHDRDRSMVLRAAGDASVSGHENSFGGEGFMYYKNGIPTINPIASYRALLAFGPGPASIDVGRVRREVVALCDLLHHLDGLSAAEISP